MSSGRSSASLTLMAAPSPLAAAAGTRSARAAFAAACVRALTGTALRDAPRSPARVRRACLADPAPRGWVRSCGRLRFGHRERERLRDLAYPRAQLIARDHVQLQGDPGGDGEMRRSLDRREDRALILDAMRERAAIGPDEQH